MISFALNKDAYFADALKSALDSKDYDTITRIIIWRSEIDLNRIKITFNARHGGVFDEIDKHAKEDNYKYMLMALLRKESREQRRISLNKDCDYIS